MMKHMIILMALVSLMMTGCVVHRTPIPAAKIPIVAQPKAEKQKPERPKPEAEKQTITYRIILIIREIIVDNVDDIDEMLPKDKKQEKKGGELLWVK